MTTPGAKGDSNMSGTEMAVQFQIQHLEPHTDSVSANSGTTVYELFGCIFNVQSSMEQKWNKNMLLCTCLYDSPPYLVHAWIILSPGLEVPGHAELFLS